MIHRPLSSAEERLLRCLLAFYREIGPAATPGLRLAVRVEGDGKG
jgi:hypothetical protein